MESSSNVVFTLSTLIDVNDRRFRHYNSLADKSADAELKSFFQSHAIRSTNFTASLNKWRMAYGASTYPEKKFNVFSQTWNQVKDIFSSSQKDSILTQCECIENETVRYYKTALALSFLPSEAVADIKKQIEAIEKACIALRTMKSNSSYLMSQAIV